MTGNSADFRVKNTTRKSTKIGRPRKHQNNAAKCRAYYKRTKQAKRRGAIRTAETPPFPTSTYRCLVIDPPWPIEKRFREARPQQLAVLDYATMPLDAIASTLKDAINQLAESDGCHVYLWVTQHFLPDGLRLFEAWGVQYSCTMTWVKNVGMTPFSWMYDTEHVLFGRIGHLDLLRKGLRLSFSAAVQGHSVKPDVFYERVRQASPGPRLDMFARRTIEGFEPWGYEAPKDADLERIQTVG